jgi:uncharacterized protein HemY
MGRIYFAAGDYHKAKEYLEKALKVHISSEKGTSTLLSLTVDF